MIVTIALPSIKLNSTVVINKLFTFLKSINHTREGKVDFIEELLPDFSFMTEYPRTYSQLRHLII